MSDVVQKSEPVNVTIDRIMEKVAKKYGISEADIKGIKRNQEIAYARHICIYIIKQMTDLSLKKIGMIFSRDHATVKASLNKTEKDIKNQKKPLIGPQILPYDSGKNLPLATPVKHCCLYPLFPYGHLHHLKEQYMEPQIFP